MSDQHKPSYVDLGQVARDQQAQVDALVASGRPFMVSGRPPMYWLGDLAGWYVSADRDGDLWLGHTVCGWKEERELPRGTVSPTDMGYGSFLANIVAFVFEHECPSADTTSDLGASNAE